MIRLRVFVSSTQKELQAERQAIGSLLVTDEFLRSCTVPRLFEEYPAPLQPNPKAYLDLLGTCSVYLLVIGHDYGRVLDDGLSATHQEYRFARSRKMPTLVCVRGERTEPREEATNAFLAEVEADHHTYSRFGNIDELLDKVRDRLKEHLQSTYDTAPTPGQEASAVQDRRVASGFERRPIIGLSVDDLDLDLARQMMAEAEETDPARWSDADVVRLLLSRGYLWWDGQGGTHRPTIAGALLLAKRPAHAPELTQARLQLEAYAGNAKDAEPLDAPFVDACLPEAIEQAVAFIRRNSARPLVVEVLKRRSAEPYPAEVRTQSTHRPRLDLAGIHGRTRQRHPAHEANPGARGAPAGPLLGGARRCDGRARGGRVGGSTGHRSCRRAAERGGFGGRRPRVRHPRDPRRGGPDHDRELREEARRVA